MNPAQILDTLAKLIADIERGVTPSLHDVHRVKTWMRGEMERLEAKRALSASQVHKMAKSKRRGGEGIAI